MRLANFAKTRNQITKCEENFNTMKKQGVKLLFAPKLVEKGVWLSIVLPLSQSILIITKWNSSVSLSFPKNLVFTLLFSCSFWLTSWITFDWV
jgi:hypothetical protein